MVNRSYASRVRDSIYKDRQKAFFNIANTNPTLWMDASYGVGTTGARLFTAANSEKFSLAADLAPTIQDFWVSFWVKVTTPGDYAVICNGATVDGRNGFEIEITATSRLQFALNDNVFA